MLDLFTRAWGWMNLFRNGFRDQTDTALSEFQGTMPVMFPLIPIR